VSQDVKKFIQNVKTHIDQQIINNINIYTSLASE